MYNDCPAVVAVSDSIVLTVMSHRVAGKVLLCGSTLNWHHFDDESSASSHDCGRTHDRFHDYFVVSTNADWQYEYSSAN